MEVADADGEADDNVSTGGGFVHVSPAGEGSDVSSADLADGAPLLTGRSTDDSGYVVVQNPSIQAESPSEDNEEGGIERIDGMQF
jgi:hypothetical protein